MFPEVLQTIPRGGRCLIIGAGRPRLAMEITKIVGADEVVLVENNYDILDRETYMAKDIVKITPVFTRVIERVVDLPSDSFDIVFAVNTLEKALNKKAFMTEVRRLLKERGRLVIYTGLRNFFIRKGLKKDEFEQLLTTAGFRVEYKKIGWRHSVAVLIKST